jgi:NADPH2:quinone reductase
MKAILVREFGSPDVLKLEEVPTPKPAAGEVLVRIHAAGVNPYDTYVRAGTYARKPPLPYTPGSDGAGVVEAVGEGVKKVKRGDRVYTTQTLSGAYGRCTAGFQSLYVMGKSPGSQDCVSRRQ